MSPIEYFLFHSNLAGSSASSVLLTPPLSPEEENELLLKSGLKVPSLVKRSIVPHLLPSPRHHHQNVPIIDFKKVSELLPTTRNNSKLVVAETTRHPMTELRPASGHRGNSKGGEVNSKPVVVVEDNKTNKTPPVSPDSPPSSSGGSLLGSTAFPVDMRLITTPTSSAFSPSSAGLFLQQQQQQQQVKSARDYRSKFVRKKKK
jgi:hypothetical protein